MRREHLDRTERTRATVLIVAMWIVLVLAGLTLVFCRAMRVEALASANFVSGLQAESVARGALQMVLSRVDGQSSPDLVTTSEAYAVGGGYFWILNPSLDDDTQVGYGIRDEASRINLNTATTEMLMNLPNMPGELAAAIVDWRDSDSDVTSGGAESEYYLLSETPYTCKNSAFETVEELLLVKGATWELLFGEDANRNGALDANENDGDDMAPADNRDGALDRGLYDYLTVFSVEPNTSLTGEARVNVNDAGGRRLGELLRGALGDRYYAVMDRVRSARPFTSVLDFYARSGLSAEEFAQVADKLTASNERTQRGLINVNTAPKKILMCLPGLEESGADALISARQAEGADLTSVAWVAKALSKEKAAAIGPWITTRSYQFSADIVAVSGDGRAFRRYRAVVDARSSPPV
ncbi:MAG TPA: type II secretion system protein GspK, partial [Candidatus Brocadiia bacterium]|nr:type II secretion system protein GspK [Candidatus Brocadiia bacterium]